jgi:hypothetical protein
MLNNDNKIQVTLLTQAYCTLCDQAKVSLMRLAEEYPLTIDVIDLGTHEGLSLATRAGILFPPGILLNSKPFSYGCLPERKLRHEIEHCLATRLASTAQTPAAANGM